MVPGEFEDTDDMTVLVTGGLGYIGSHTCVSLLQSGRDVVILDNLSNSVPLVAQRIEAIAGRKPVFVQGDMLDGSLLDRLFAEHRIGSVIHFAGYKAVGEFCRRAVEVLPQQSDRHAVSVGKHVEGGRQDAGVLVVGDRLR